MGGNTSHSRFRLAALVGLFLHDQDLVRCLIESKKKETWLGGLGRQPNMYKMHYTSLAGDCRPYHHLLESNTYKGGQRDGKKGKKSSCTNPRIARNERRQEIG